MKQIIHTEESAPEAATALLEAVRGKYGFVPNLAGSMADTPVVLDGYLELESAFRDSALSPIEQEVVTLTVSFANGCQYCMAGHSMLASMVGMDAGDLAGLRAGEPLPTPRLEALRAFAVALLEATGPLDPDLIAKVADAGYSRDQLAAVPLGIAFKTLSNLSHHIQPVPVDDAFADHAWEGSTAPTRVLVSGWLRPDGEQALADYQRQAGPIMAANGGKPVLKSKPATTWVGEGPDVVVVMEFPSEEAVSAAFADAQYETLIPLREEAFARLDVTRLS